jgi:hypothetical protein
MLDECDSRTEFARRLAGAVACRGARADHDEVVTVSSHALSCRWLHGQPDSVG